jgi:hypothetical protein
MFFIPQGYAEKIGWAQNFRDKFPQIAEAHNFNDEETAMVHAACESIIFAINLAYQAKRFSQACTTFRNTQVKSKQTKVGLIQKIPVFTAARVPETLAPPDALGYLQKVIRRLKAQSNYERSTGVNLRIVSMPRTAPSLTDAMPKGKLISLPNSVVRIDWKKGKFHGVAIYSKRGDETDWTLLDKDNYSPYIDTRPPLEAGKPEIRYYKFVYLYEDKRVGTFSPIYTQVTTP